jgi:L-lactate dehydrogenase complex protein LldG
VENTWIETLCSILEQKQINKILYGAKTGLAQEIGNLKQESTEMMPELIDYKDPIEESKDLLFEIDAAITTTRGGIAETGSLILWPTPDEPRLMSLVPPIHIAVLYARDIYSTFLEAMISENWSSEMPTNALLISGPSKTADIEQTLVYGVHGCKELVVLVIQ